MFYGSPIDEKPLERIPADGGFAAVFRTIACIGDSLSSGGFDGVSEGSADAYSDNFEYSWGQYIARAIGATVHNMSKGGMTAHDYLPFAEEKGFWAPEYASQAYIIALGVNDMTWAFGGTIGSMADIDLEHPENNRPTFAGDYARIIQKILIQQPKARIFLMTMPRDPNHSEELNGRLDAHASLLYRMAETFPFTYVMDFRKYAPVYDAEFHRLFYMGSHLNAAGYLLTSKWVMAYLDYLIRHNPEEFCQVGYIGKGIHNPDYKW